MNANFLVHAKSLICAAALTGCAALAGAEPAQPGDVTVNIAVGAAGLHLDQPADALTLYGRVRRAAHIACGNGNRVDLQPPTNVDRCFEQAVADAVRSANQPQLTAIYLKIHTLEDAASRGIGVRVAAK